MSLPLVSVICTCYNHDKFILDALNSVIKQSYKKIELVVIDNGSRDLSVDKIRFWIGHNKAKISIKTFFYSKTINYCQSFNRGLAVISGKYLIDLSGDDVLLQEHLTNAVHILESNPGAIYFSNAYLEKEGGKAHSTFYPLNRRGLIATKIPSGNIYEHVIQRTVLCAPTLVVPARSLIDEGGYDENLSYEDFDIIVRLARKYRFVFSENIGVKKRILNTSFSAQQYRARNSVMLPSTLIVCQKILQMNKTVDEDRALALRILFEWKHALASANFDAARGFLELATRAGIGGLRYWIFRFWGDMKLDISFLYRWLVRFR